MEGGPGQHEVQSLAAIAAAVDIHVSVRYREAFLAVKVCRSANSGVLRMLYHATNILLYRLILDPADISTGEGHAATCLEHSITANQRAFSFAQTFGERMTYVAMYSSFVAAWVSSIVARVPRGPALISSRSFDLVLLESDNIAIQLEALVRLRVWLGLMEDVSQPS